MKKTNYAPFVCVECNHVSHEQHEVENFDNICCFCKDEFAEIKDEERRSIKVLILIIIGAIYICACMFDMSITGYGSIMMRNPEWWNYILMPGQFVMMIIVFSIAVIPLAIPLLAAAKYVDEH